MTRKRFFRIGEACRELDIPPYVLRYWETEFSALKPEKSKAGQRVYGEETLAVIRRIKELLYQEGYTIAGAKKRLEKELTEGGPLADGGEESVRGPAAVIAAASDSARQVDRKATERLKRGVREALESARALRDLLS